jgi:hypothetical protein
MKSIIFWDMTLYCPLSCARRFGGTYRLHLQAEEIGSANQLASRWQLCCKLIHCLSDMPTFDPEIVPICLDWIL